ncbi:hypothetical protein B0H13DRAFT_1997591 [Mycena leptocephala]|nr:hypothetical protein B0H13DRAFT_1997591 [Mycena leptocephala]
MLNFGHLRGAKWSVKWSTVRTYYCFTSVLLKACRPCFPSIGSYRFPSMRPLPSPPTDSVRFVWPQDTSAYSTPSTAQTFVPPKPSSGAPRLLKARRREGRIFTHTPSSSMSSLDSASSCSIITAEFWLPPQTIATIPMEDETKITPPTTPMPKTKFKSKPANIIIPRNTSSIAAVSPTYPTSPPLPLRSPPRPIRPRHNPHRPDIPAAVSNVFTLDDVSWERARLAVMGPRATKKAKRVLGGVHKAPAEVNGRGTWRKKENTWSGEWNVEDMEELQVQLRRLRRR